MASRFLDEDRNSPPRSAEGTEQAAAEWATGELALAVLAAPGPPQLAILGHLEQKDKLNLGATCTSLQQASLVWFPEVTAEVVLVKTDVASLAAWLERHQACLHLSDVLHDDDDDGTEHGPLEVEWNDSLMALPASLIVSLTTGYQLCSHVSTLTALTGLELEGWSWKDCLYGSISPRHLQPLTRLKQLGVRDGDIGSIAEELLSLPALTGLQDLYMSNCSLQTMPRALSAHTQLTALDLFVNDFSTTEPIATLQRLQRLDLSYCSLTAVPAQLSALTALTSLNLAEVERLDRGWQHLAPLIQLQDLDLRSCSLTAVPAQLSALTALTCLDLGNNDLLGRGWQHLLPLIRLCHLVLYRCHLTALPQQLSVLTALTSLDLTSALRARINAWQHLLPLIQLRELFLKDSRLKTIPEQVATLTALTCLCLADNNKLHGGCQHLLPLTRLQDLDLSGCKLKAVPAELSALAALTRLNLYASKRLAGGWQNLLCLTLLQDLDLSGIKLKAVPAELSALTTLTNLDLSRNRELAGGWQHLLPLTQLRQLDLRNARLPGREVPAELAAMPRLSMDYYGLCCFD
ncbi:Leucine-rich repeat and death domain-containing protein 1 [Chlorella vulgaris]